MALFASATAVQAQTELVIDGSKGYDGTLVKGQDYVLPGTDASWYVMPDIFTHKSGDVWTFQAYGQADYAYWFTADPDKKYVKVEYRQVDDDPESAFANWDINRALYINGSNNIGFPSYKTNPINWQGGADVAVPQVEPNIYRVTLVFGQQLNADAQVNFKFFKGKNWGGDILPGTGDGNVWMEENPWLYIGGQDGASGDNGNLYSQSTASFGDGDKLIVTIDMNYTPGKVTVDYQEYVPADFPTFNGTNMVKVGNNYYYESYLAKGDAFTLGNTSVVDMDIDNAYVDEFAATNQGGGKFTFNAVSGNYTVLVMPALNYVKIFPGFYASPGTFDSDKAVWIIGSNIGQPSAALNGSNWSASLMNSIPVAQVSENVYKVSLTYGQELTGVNYKFFGQYGWGMEFHGEDLAMEPNDYFYVNTPQGEWVYDENGNEIYQRGSDDGNIFAGPVALGKGDKVTLTIDLNGFVPGDPANDIQAVPGKVTVEFSASVAPKPTLNGVEMTPNGDNYVADIDLNRGDVFTIVAPDFNIENVYTDKQYATNMGGGTFQFNALAGKYTVALMEGKNNLKIFPGTMSAPANIHEGGLWIIGDGIGRPTVNYDAPSWNTGALVDIPVAQVEPNIYRYTVTCGVEMWDTWCNYKFFGQPNWGIEFVPGTDYAITTDNEYLQIGASDGNVSFKGAFEWGKTYTVTIDFTQGLNAGVMTVVEGEILGVKDIETFTEKGSDAIYTISGMRVKNPAQRGIYIVNGKKMVK
ncbi:MAG: DUF5121 domain-containing protein [Prevotella sp.]|nr:DUF5121 domain-containing protein [Prevotella sp.]